MTGLLFVAHLFDEAKLFTEAGNNSHVEHGANPLVFGREPEQVQINDRSPLVVITHMHSRTNPSIRPETGHDHVRDRQQPHIADIADLEGLRGGRFWMGEHFVLLKGS